MNSFQCDDFRVLLEDAFHCQTYEGEAEVPEQGSNCYQITKYGIGLNSRFSLKVIFL